MDFEWDEIKALINQKKHRVSFIEASEVFEERYLIFGVEITLWYLTQKEQMLSVLFQHDA